MSAAFPVEGQSLRVQALNLLFEEGFQMRLSFSVRVLYSNFHLCEEDKTVS